MLCIHWYDSLGSTNAEAVRLAKEGAAEGTVVWSEEQTAGRGRRGHAWASPRGNLYMSVILRPGLPFALAGRLSVACGAAAADTLCRQVGCTVRTKWPNDLYLDGRKLGGILVETRTRPEGVLEWAVVGIGLNVASHPDVPPPGQPATCLAHFGEAPPLPDLVASLAASLCAAGRTACSEEGWRQIQEGWVERDVAAGPISIVEDEGTYEAEGLGLEDDGALLVRVGETDVRRVTAGDVSVRFAA